jgi:hypothetical protein
VGPSPHARGEREGWGPVGGLAVVDGEPLGAAGRVCGVVVAITGVARRPAPGALGRGHERARAGVAGRVRAVAVDRHRLGAANQESGADEPDVPANSIPRPNLAMAICADVPGGYLPQPYRQLVPLRTPIWPTRLPDRVDEGPDLVVLS